MAPGRYQMRIGARDPNTGKAGTVFYDVIVPDFAREPVMMSGLLLVAAMGGPDVLTPQRDPGAEKLLGAPATSRREFSQIRNAGVARPRSTTTHQPASRSRSMSAQG